MKRLLATVLALALLPLAADASPQRRRRAPQKPRAQVPAKARPTALVVLLENGGVALNLEECLGDRGARVKLPILVSGDALFPLQRGESLPKALARLADTLRSFALNPAARRWKVESVTADEWVERTSDFVLEEVSKSLTAANGIRSIYDRVIVLEDEELTPERAVSVIRGLGPGYDIDVHTLVHGGKNAFFGFEHARFDEESFFGKLRGQKLNFRAVYQMNCVSGTLMDEWLALGAQAVNGTLDERNNYMPQSYFHFQAEWVKNATFGSAITQSYARSRAYSEPVYEALGMLQEIEDSRMRVLGATGLRARPTTLQIAKGVINAGVQTALGLAAELRARGENLQAAARELLAAGHGVATSAAALVEAFGADARDVAAALGAAGAQLTEVGATLAAEFSLSAKDMFRALRAAGGSVRESLGVMLSDQARSLAECVRAAREAGAEVGAIVEALRHKTLRRSYTKIASALTNAGVSPSQIAATLKERGKGAGEVARWLKGAGVSARDVAKVLRSRFSCGVQSAVAHLESAGFGFAGTAKAVWNEVIRRRARSTWPQAIAQLTGELASHFQRSAAWVAGELVKLGIRP